MPPAFDIETPTLATPTSATPPAVRRGALFHLALGFLALCTVGLLATQADPAMITGRAGIAARATYLLTGPDNTPSGPNWAAVEDVMACLEGHELEEILDFLDDDVVYRVKGPMLAHVVKYVGKDRVMKYLRKQAKLETREPDDADAAEYAPFMSEDGSEITIFLQAKQWSSWWKVRVVFTFKPDGKIVDVWVGEDAGVPLQVAMPGSNWGRVVSA